MTPTELQQAKKDFEQTLKTFVAINCDGQIVWRTRCRTQDQASRKWEHACPKYHFACQVKEIKGEL